MVTWEKEKLDPVQVGRARNNRNSGWQERRHLCRFVSTPLASTLCPTCPHQARSSAGSFPCEADSCEVFAAALRMSGLVSSFQFYFNSLCRIHHTHLTEPWLSPVHYFSSSQKSAILFTPQQISKLQGLEQPEAAVRNQGRIIMD